MRSGGYLLDTSGERVKLRAASLEEQVKESLRGVLLTRQGERTAHPELGSLLHRYLFRPLSQSLLSEMKEEVKRSISCSEDRVRVAAVEIRQRGDNAEQIELLVDFEIKQTRKAGQVKVELHA